jgi:hypothetical protein
MTYFFADLVREFSSSAGTGDFVLDGAVPGHRRFTAAVPAGARFHYCIAGVTRPGEWEVGEGELGSGGSLVRAATVSSAGGDLVDFSAGLKSVALTVAADWFSSHTHDFALLSGRPTTLAGYGISDAAATRGELGLGSAATRNVGTAGAAIGLLDAESLTWSGSASWGGTGRFVVASSDGVGIPAWGSSHMVVSTGSGPADIGLAVSVDAAAEAANISVVTPGVAWHPLRLRGAGFGFFVDGASEVVRIDGGGLNVSSTIRIGGVQVAGGRRGGWTAATGSASRTGFDTDSVTTTGLAERVKALIDDLIAHGLIGA